LKAKKYSTLKNALAYKITGVVAVNFKVVGLAPGFDCLQQWPLPMPGANPTTSEFTTTAPAL
jgi:hypothetical protein